MTLQELFEKSYAGLTDKGDTHDYINGYYQEEFKDKRDAALNILEIGVFEGGSMMMFSEWMPNAIMEGIDINTPRFMAKNTYIGDAYCQDTVSRYQDGHYDYIIDDGPHTLESMLYAIRHYTSKLKEGGKLIIEDVRNISWCDDLRTAAMEKGLVKFTIFDLRSNKNRYDDILVEIVKL